MTRGNPWVLSGAVLVVVGFCMGWVGLRGLGGGLFVDGWGVLGFLRERSSAYWLLYALPVGAIAAGVAALFDRRAAATLALVVGLGLLAWSAFEVARIGGTRPSRDCGSPGREHWCSPSPASARGGAPELQTTVERIAAVGARARRLLRWRWLRGNDALPRRGSADRRGSGFVPTARPFGGLALELRGA